MFEQLKKMKAIQDVINSAQNDDPEGAVKTLVSLGVDEKTARASVEKIIGLKKAITEKVMNGEIKTAEDVMAAIKNTGVVPPESFEKIMEKINERFKKE